MLIYCENITPRLQYIVELLFNELLGLNALLTINKEEFLSYAGPCMSYSDTPVAAELNIKPVSLLTETGIKKQSIMIEDYESLKMFFKTGGIIPFDLFAASFYLVSRYEEYEHPAKDQYGRFPYPSSFLSRYNLVERALVNEYSAFLKQKLSERFRAMEFKMPAYSFISTIDIDNAFAFKNKGALRTAGAILKHLIKFEFKTLANRISVLTGKQNDPFDTYGYLQRIHFENKLKPKLFYLVGNLSKYDRNVSIHSAGVKQQYRNNDYWSESCLHPSYQSNFNPGLIKMEGARLEGITGRTVTKSRQHFLKFHLPGTYRNLIEAGIKEDYSMGFAERAGFRAGICTPFYFFDLKRNEKSGLRLVPLTVMDSTLNSYMKLSPEKAMELINKLAGVVKNHGGCFVTLWHNETVSETGIWKNWRSVFEHCIRVGLLNTRHD